MNRFSYLFLVGAILLFSGFRASHSHYKPVFTPIGDSSTIIASFKPILDTMVNKRAQKLSAERRTNVNYTLSGISYKTVDLAEADKAALNGVFLERNNYADRLNYATGDSKRSYTDSLARYTLLDSLIRNKAKTRKSQITIYQVSYKASMNAASFFEAADGMLFFDMKFRMLEVGRPAEYLMQMDSL